MNTWQIGDIKITKVIEGLSEFELTEIIPEATAENLQPLSDWLCPHYLEGSKAKLSIHSFVIQTADKTILVDTCVGNDKERKPYKMWHQLNTSYLQDLQAAGFAREDIDVVLCTHLHVDHVGWNTMLVENEWVPTFPNARYLIAEKEWQFWSQSKDIMLSKQVLADSVQPLFDANQVDLVQLDHKICDEVYFVATPGHTPGHISLKIDSNGQQAVLSSQEEASSRTVEEL